MATNIELIIRTTNQKYVDFNLRLSSTATIFDLKEAVQRNHPAKPIPEDQRLIFGGKLLEDPDSLQQVFLKATSSGSSFMVHLVLAADKNSSPSTASSSSRPASVPVSPSPSASASASSSSQEPSVEQKPIYSSSYEQYLAELNDYQQQLQQFIANPNTIPTGLNFQTQAYLQYCQTHYHLYENLLNYQRNLVAPSPPVSSINVPPAAAAAPAPVPAPAPAAPPNNNNNEMEQENDLLGVLNMLAELFVLCSIIYFYSTFNRFLVVFVIFALLYLHCRGYLTLQRRRRVQVAPAAAPVDPVANNEAEHVGREDEPDAEAAAAAPVNDLPNVNEGQQPRTMDPLAPDDSQVTTTRLLITAVSTFFSSLIPERPQRA